MGAWNFKKQFADAVESGEKCTTIRNLRKDSNNPKVGENMRCYTGMRSTSCRLLRDWTPILERLRFAIDSDRRVSVDGIELLYVELRNLAIADGFDGIESFVDFFETVHRLPFEGFWYCWEAKS